MYHLPFLKKLFLLLYDQLLLIMFMMKSEYI